MKFRDIFGAEEAGIRRYSNDDKPKRAEIAPFERVRITLVTLNYERLCLTMSPADTMSAFGTLCKPGSYFLHKTYSLPLAAIITTATAVS